MVPVTAAGDYQNYAPMHALCCGQLQPAESSVLSLGGSQRMMMNQEIMNAEGSRRRFILRSVAQSSTYIVSKLLLLRPTTTTTRQRLYIFGYCTTR